MIGRGCSLGGRGRGNGTWRAGRGAGKSANANASTSRSHVPLTEANNVATPNNTTPSNSHINTPDPSSHSVGTNVNDDEAMSQSEDESSIISTLTGRMPEVKCHCHGKIQVTISKDSKHFLGSTAPARTYRKLIHTRSTEFWPKWNLVDVDVKETWWQEFQGAFCLPTLSNQVVRKAWEKIGALQYASTIHSAHKHWKKTGKKMDWIKEEIFPKFVQLWTSEEFKKRSEQASRNRNTNADGVGMPGKHTGGSIPFAEHSQRMKRVRGEVHPGLAYNITHRKKGTIPNELGPWVNAKSEQTYSQYMSLVVGGSEPSCDLPTQSGTPQLHTLLKTRPDKIPWNGKRWSEAVGGVKRGNRVYGFGEDQSVLHDDTNSSNGSSSSQHPMTRDDAVRIIQENPIFKEIIADTVSEKVKEAIAETVSGAMADTAREVVDHRFMEFVRQIGVYMGVNSGTSVMLEKALQHVLANQGGSTSSSTP